MSGISPRPPSWNSGLPEGWSAGETSEGRVFFINHAAQTTSWNHPVSGRRFGGKGSGRRGKGGGGGGARGVIGRGGGGGGGGGDISSLSSLSRETSSPGGGGRGNFLSPTQGWEVSASASPPHLDHTSLSPPSYSRGHDAGGGDQGRSIVSRSSSIGVGADVDGGTHLIHHPGSGGRRDQDREHPSSSAVSPSGTEVSGLDQVLLELVEGRQLGRLPFNSERSIGPGSPLPDSDVLLRQKVLPYVQNSPPSTSSAPHHHHTISPLHFANAAPQSLP
jgi:hypothetical protein